MVPVGDINRCAAGDTEDIAVVGDEAAIRQTPTVDGSHADEAGGLGSCAVEDVRVDVGDGVMLDHQPWGAPVGVDHVETPATQIRHHDRRVLASC